MLEGVGERERSPGGQTLPFFRRGSMIAIVSTTASAREHINMRFSLFSTFKHSAALSTFYSILEGREEHSRSPR